MAKKIAALAFVSSLSFAFTGCTADAADDATIEVGVGSVSSALQADGPAASDGGAASTTISDSHASARVRIKVKEIRVHIAGTDVDKNPGAVKGAVKPVGSPEGTPDVDDGASDGKEGGAGWITVFKGERLIDLDRTASLDAILGSAHAKPGKLTQVRLILDGAAVLVENGVETPLACGSCDTSGLKIVPKGTTRLESGTHRRLVLAVDLGKSLVDEGGQLRLKPVLRLADGS